jgi:fatty acid desaturase
LFGWATPLLYWIGPQVFGQPPLRAYLLAEHTGCSLDRNGLTNTRTTLTCAPVRLLMWNMPYHAEHHLFPSIPFHRLADAHRLVRAKLGVVQAGYVRWNCTFVRSLAGR